MTEVQGNSRSAPRLAGKWQGPLFVVGVVVCALAAWRWVASSPQASWDDHFSRIVTLTESAKDGDYTEAEAAVRTLLDPKNTPQSQRERRAKLFAHLAEIRWRIIQLTSEPAPLQLAAVRDCYLAAIKNKLSPTAEIAERLGRVYDGLGDVPKAVEWYERATQLDPSRAAKLNRRAIELARDRLGLSGEKLVARLREFMASEGLDQSQYAWAIDEAVGVLIAENRADLADRLVLHEQGRVAGEGFEQQLLYQRARLHAELGLRENADNLLIQLIPQLSVASDLYAKANLLRGQLIWRDNPLEAEKVLVNVLRQAPQTQVATAASVTLARAYGQMALYDKALAQYGLVTEGLLAGPANPYVELPDIHEALAGTGQALSNEGRPDEALAFAQAEGALFDVSGAPFSVAERLLMLGRLAGMYMAVAQKAETDYAKARADLAAKDELIRLKGRRTDHLRAAGEVFLDRAATAEKTNITVRADSLWMAADAFGKAGQLQKAIDALKTFVASRPSDERVPEAMFRLGRRLQSLGRYDQAIDVYKKNLASSRPEGRHAKAAEGLVPMAMCYVAKGEDFYDEAESILVSILNDKEAWTPESELYHGALYVLGRLYHMQGKWSQARVRLGEAIQRSPGKLVGLGQPDEQGRRWRYVRATRGQFLMAHSYHQSARELAKQAAGDEEPQRADALRRLAGEQLVWADVLYQQVIEQLEALGDQLPALDETYRRNSYFNGGDCMYELTRYDQALKRYQEAVFRFQTHPAALGGLMQMYNSYIAMGQPDEARKCQQRAKELSKLISTEQQDDQYQQLLPEDWDQWVDTVGQLDPHGMNEESQ